MVQFTNMDDYRVEHLVGFLPYWLNELDPDRADEQIGKKYVHGGGWNEFEGFELVLDTEKSKIGEYHLKGKGDPTLVELSRAYMRDEIVVVFDHSWIMVVTPATGDFTVARID